MKSLRMDPRGQASNLSAWKPYIVVSFDDAALVLS